MMNQHLLMIFNRKLLLFIATTLLCFVMIPFYSISQEGICKRSFQAIKEIVLSLRPNHSFVLSNQLHIAVNNMDLSTAETLTKQGANVNIRNQHGNTLLHIAIFNNHLAMVKFLIQQGADVNARNQHGNTPLHIATFNYQLDVTQVLIQAKAKLNAKDISGDTPLRIAKNRGAIELVQALVVAGAQ